MLHCRFCGRSAPECVVGVSSMGAGASRGRVGDSTFGEAEESASGEAGGSVLNSI